MGLRSFLMRMGLNLSDVEVYARTPFFRYQGAPVAMTTADTITVAALLGGIITGTHAAGGDQAYTLPTGADLDAALTSFITNNASFDFTIINLSPADGDDIVLTASVGITIVGQAAISSNEFEASYYHNSGLFRMRKTADDTFVCYRLV